MQLSALAPQLLAVSEDEEGMRSDLLEATLEQALNSGSTGVLKVR